MKNQRMQIVLSYFLLVVAGSDRRGTAFGLTSLSAADIKSRLKLHNLSELKR